ncbi:hypothetical protein E5676_scaffold2119G00500 [Cucumis melo var. makuwa]|uniref:Protein MNN4-like n=1 Tax=Cucumis melo var. makuwa TaxID=1194695 RepID=A0A5A7VFZ4_CUCMM|nr:hypothetical protein E6C27_scaffold979G001010 [Cucumis melo var. makuwa]TYK04112.1 hypothetical protein E5676_scaffold2119G00500 [Cucumis melo var. makuwa]
MRKGKQKRRRKDWSENKNKRRGSLERRKKRGRKGMKRMKSKRKKKKEWREKLEKEKEDERKKKEDEKKGKKMRVEKKAEEKTGKVKSELLKKKGWEKLLSEVDKVAFFKKKWRNLLMIIEKSLRKRLKNLVPWRLCIKACSELEKSPKVEVSDGVCTGSTLRRVIAIYKNKAKIRCLKTKQEGQKEVKDVDSGEEEKGKENEDPLKRKRQGGEKAKSSKAKDSKETLSHAAS